VPEGAKSGAYWPGEVEKSQKSGGQVLDTPPPESGGQVTALFYDFLPCSSELRPAHGKLIGLIRTRMGWPSGRHDGHLLTVYGTVDEIEGFIGAPEGLGGPKGLDTARASAVKQAFDSTGEFITLGPSVIDRPGVDHPDVMGIGVSPVMGTPENRLAARAVSVTYTVAARETAKPKWPADTKSRRWAIAQAIGSSAVLGGGWVDIGFYVKNLASGQEYKAHFSGQAKGTWPQFGLGISGSVPFIPHFWSEFSTNEPIAASELDGPNAVYEMLTIEAHVPPVGAGWARLKLARPTTPRPIALKLGPEISIGVTPVSVIFETKGTFSVLGPN
jgi:hypothetical protein